LRSSDILAAGSNFLCEFVLYILGHGGGYSKKILNNKLKDLKSYKLKGLGFTLYQIN